MIAIRKIGLVCLSMGLACVNVLTAQQIRVTQPLTSVSDSFFERTGVGFGFHLNGGRGPGSRVVGLLPNGQLNPGGAVRFSQNGVSSAIPPFGGFDPNTQGHFGFGVIGNNGGFNLSLFGGKGSNRSSVTTAPSVVVPNGGFGSIFSGQLRPFVTGINPVLGRGTLIPPGYLDKPAERHEPTSATTYSDPHSSAMQGDISVEEIVRRRESEQTQRQIELVSQIQELVDAADELVASEKYGAARAKYGRAMRKIKDAGGLDTLRESVSTKLTEIKYKR